MAAGPSATAAANAPASGYWVVGSDGHVYHFAGSKDYGNTKHGAFMCRADADRAGTLHAAKNELRMQGGSDRTVTSRFSGSSTNRY